MWERPTNEECEGWPDTLEGDRYMSRVVGEMLRARKSEAGLLQALRRIARPEEVTGNLVGGSYRLDEWMQAVALAAIAKAECVSRTPTIKEKGEG